MAHGFREFQSVVVEKTWLRELLTQPESVGVGGSGFAELGSGNNLGFNWQKSFPSNPPPLFRLHFPEFLNLPKERVPPAGVQCSGTGVWGETFQTQTLAVPKVLKRSKDLW